MFARKGIDGLCSLCKHNHIGHQVNGRHHCLRPAHIAGVSNRLNKKCNQATVIRVRVTTKHIVYDLTTGHMSWKAARPTRAPLGLVTTSMVDAALSF